MSDIEKGGEKKEAKQIPKWNCQLSNPQEKIQKEITVGQKLLLSCKGPFAPLKREGVSFKADEKAKYRLFLLNSQNVSETQANLVVTSYTPGNHKGVEVVLTDGETEVLLSGIDFQIKSVVEKQQGKQPKPFGPFGPFEIALPQWIWLSILGAILVGIVIGAVWGFSAWQRRKIKEGLRRHQTALSPFNQFNKDLRKLKRRMLLDKAKENRSARKEALELLDENWRLYLIRQFLVPAQDWSDRRILGDIKKYHRKVYDHAGTDLQKVLGELRKSKKDTEKLSDYDVDQLTKICQKAADRVWEIERR